MVDATGGAVPDATARLWAATFMASVRWTVDAVEHERPDTLEALSTPGDADSATLHLIDDARADDAQLSYPPGHGPHVTRLLLVVLSADQTAAIRQGGGAVAGPDAWVVTFSGPTDLAVRWPGGQLQSYTVLPAGRQVTELSAGGVVEDPSLGAIWRETYSRDCTAHPDPVLCPY